jgi:hypothetical protein
MIMIQQLWWRLNKLLRTASLNSYTILIFKIRKVSSLAFLVGPHELWMRPKKDRQFPIADAMKGSWHGAAKTATDPCIETPHSYATEQHDKEATN